MDLDVTTEKSEPMVEMDGKPDVSHETNEAVPAESAEAPAASTEAPAYQPNYKYKVLDKELEIDDKFRPFIKDPDTEKAFKEVFEKAGGLDHYKTKYSSLEQKMSQIEPEYNKIVQDVQRVGQLWKVDKGAFFDALGFDKKEVYKWVLEQAKYQELPEDVRKVYDGQREATLRTLQLEKQNEQYAERVAQYNAQARAFELSQELNKSDYVNAVSAFDEIYGKGAFENEVIQYGAFQSQMSGKDVGVAEAVSAVIGKAKAIEAKLGSPNAAVQREAPKAIPTIKAGASSPAKKRITSLDELKKLAEQMED